MLSPSTTVTTRRGTLDRWKIEVAAIGSVGETTAPSTIAALQERSSIQAWAIAATAKVVARTRPIESSDICLTFGPPGTKPTVRPRRTNRMGYGTSETADTTNSAATATSTPSSTSSVSVERAPRTGKVIHKSVAPDPG